MSKKKGLFDRLRRAFQSKDAEEFEKELKKAEDDAGEEGVDPTVPGNHVTINVTPGMAQEAKGEKDATGSLQNIGMDPYVEIKRGMDALSAKFDSIAERLDKMEKEKTEDEAAEEEKKRKDEEEAKGEADRANKDSATMDAATISAVRAEFQQTISRAEVLSPGVKLPQFDAATSKATMADRMCGLRTLAVRTAFADEKRKTFVVEAAGSSTPNFDAMSCDQMTVVFNAAAALARAANSARRVSFADQNFPQGKMTAEKMQAVIEQKRAADRAGVKKSA